MAQKPPPENGYPATTLPSGGTRSSPQGTLNAVHPPVKPRQARPPVATPEHHAEQMAAAFAQVLPTLLHATARVTTDQQVFLEHLAERKGQWTHLAPFIQGTLTETEALFLRRVLIGMPDAGTEKPTP